MSELNEERGRASSGARDIFSGFKTSLCWGKDTPLTIANGEVDGLELGNMFPDGKQSKKASAIHAIGDI